MSFKKSLKKILKKIDITADCRKYGLGFWQCPNSLFLIMGVIIVVAMIITYWIGMMFVEPELIIVTVSIVTTILLIIGHSLVNSFARVAEANRMKIEFVSIVSHQLRTPLSALKWSLGLLRGKRLGEITKKQKEYLDIIKKSTDKMINLVNDLLSVSRIEQQRLRVRPEKASIEDLIKEVVVELSPLAKAHNVKINFEDQKNLPPAQVDPGRIQMVIQNLVDNAIKYSKEKGGTVNISAETSEKNKKMIKVLVKDDGQGIPHLIQKHIFGKFFRGENLIKQKVEGTGLGLFIAKGIVNLSGGKMGFVSEKGKGSTFWFTIPVAKK